MRPLRPVSTTRAVGRVTRRTSSLERRDVGGVTGWVLFEEPFDNGFEWSGDPYVRPAWKRNPNHGKHPFIRGAVTGGTPGTSPFAVPSEAGAPFDGTEVRSSALSDGSELVSTTIDEDGVVFINAIGTTGYVPGGTDVPIVDGGTGASTASGARTNLGVAVGSDVQAFSAKLAAIAALTWAADKLMYFTGSGAVATTDLSSFIRGLLDDSDAATARGTLGVIASLFQSGGAQAIKLDDLATPDDNTDLNATTGHHGLVPKLPNDATKYYDGTGVFSTPSGGGGGGGTPADVQVFDAGTSQTWTKPSGSPLWVQTIEIGAGGGAGGGAASVNTAKSGGSPGGGGSVKVTWYRASDLGATENVDVGTGGAGGAGAAAGAGASGSPGSNGSGPTKFGSHGTGAPAGGGGLGGTNAALLGGGGASMANPASGTTAGVPSSTSAAVAGQGGACLSGNSNGTPSERGGASGGGCTISAVPPFVGGSSVEGGPGGGPGGRVNSSNAGQAGGDGGTTGTYTAGGGAAGGTGGGSPTDGGDGTFTGPYCGQGGGGGGGGTSVTGKNGGTGGRGAGGGGGGSSGNAAGTTNGGGTGGAGGDGHCIIITYF